MELLNKIDGLVQAERCLFNIFCDDKFEQLEPDPRVFCKFDDGEVPAELGGNFKMKSMVEKFGVEKASRTSASSGLPTLSQSG